MQKFCINRAWLVGCKWCEGGGRIPMKVTHSPRCTFQQSASTLSNNQLRMISILLCLLTADTLTRKPITIEINNLCQLCCDQFAAVGSFRGDSTNIRAQYFKGGLVLTWREKLVTTVLQAVSLMTAFVQVLRSRLCRLRPFQLFQLGRWTSFPCPPCPPTHLMTYNSQHTWSCKLYQELMIWVLVIKVWCKWWKWAKFWIEATKALFCGCFH